MTGFNIRRSDRRQSNFSSPTSAPPSSTAASVEYASTEARSRSLDVSFDATRPDAQTARPPSQRIRLNLDQLRPFEVVERQFQHRGVVFSNAIALIPSNPAFPSRNGQTVLMGCPKSGWLEARFESPVEFVAGFVTASCSTIMAAYDGDGQPLAQAKTVGSNLAGSESKLSPNTELSLKAQNIRRVTFQSFDGQLTLGEFCFDY